MDAGHEPQQRRLPRAVVADEPVGRALRDGHRDVTQRPELLVVRPLAAPRGDRLLEAARAFAVQPEALRDVVDDDRRPLVGAGRPFRGAAAIVGHRVGVGVGVEHAHSSSLTRPAKRRKIAHPITTVAIETAVKPAEAREVRHLEVVHRVAHPTDEQRERVEAHQQLDGLRRVVLDEVDRVHDRRHVEEHVQADRDEILDVTEVDVEEAADQAQADREHHEQHDQVGHEDERPRHVPQDDHEEQEDADFDPGLRQRDQTVRDHRALGREVHLPQQPTGADEGAHRAVHDRGEEVPDDEAAEEIQREVLQGAVARDRRLHLQQRAEHDGVHEQGGRRVDEGPGPPEHAALVARLQLALREVPDESSVAPELGCCCHTWRKLALRPAACPEGSRPRYAVRPVPGGTSAPGQTRLGRPSRLRRLRGLRHLRRRYGGSRFHGAHEPGCQLARARPGDAGRHRARSASRPCPMLRTRIECVIVQPAAILQPCRPHRAESRTSGLPVGDRTSTCAGRTRTRTRAAPRPRRSPRRRNSHECPSSRIACTPVLRRTPPRASSAHGSTSCDTSRSDPRVRSGPRQPRPWRPPDPAKRRNSSMSSSPTAVTLRRVLACERLDRRRRPARIEREPAVGKQDQRDTVEPQDAVDVVEQAHRIGNVLQHVTRDDEVERRGLRTPTAGRR